MNPLLRRGHWPSAVTSPAGGALGHVVFGASPPPPPSFDVTGDVSLVQRFEADVGVSVTDHVTLWADQAGSQNMDTIEGSPQLITGSHGHPAISLANSSLRRMTTLTGLPFGDADRTLYAVAKFVDAPNWGGLAYGLSQNNQAFGFVTEQTTGQFYLHRWGGSYDLALGTVADPNTWYLLEGLAGSGEIEGSINGTAFGPVAGACATAASRTVFGPPLNNTGYKNIEISAWLLYNKKLSASERAAVSAYLNGKYFS